MFDLSKLWEFIQTRIEHPYSVIIIVLAFWAMVIIGIINLFVDL